VEEAALVMVTLKMRQVEMEDIPAARTVVLVLIVLVELVEGEVALIPQEELEVCT